MPDLWLDVDAALAEVPVNISPLLDDTDFKTREEAVAYDAAGMELIWHFTTTAGATSATVVTPTTGGDYDWAHQDGAMYTIEMTASGGASANNDTEGVGWFTGVADGVVPWRGPTIGFRAVAINNALIDDAFDAVRGFGSPTALPNAAAEALGGLYTRGSGAGQINQQTNGQVDTNVSRIVNDPNASLGLGKWLTVSRTGTSDSGSTTTMVDASRTEGDDAWNDAGLVFTSGANFGRMVLVTDFDAASDTCTFTPAVPTGVTTELYVLVPGLGLAGVRAWLGTAVSALNDISAADVWDRVISMSNHNIGQSAGKILRQSGDLIQIDGAVSDASPSVTSFDTNLTQIDTFFNDAILVFSNGSANAGIGKPVSAYLNANGNVTFVADLAWPVTPVNGDDFVIIAVHEHPVSETVDAIWAKTMTELSSVPGVTGTVLAALEWLFLQARNKGTQTSTTKTMRNDADDGNIATAAISDDGTTFTREEWS